MCDKISEGRPSKMYNNWGILKGGRLSFGLESVKSNEAQILSCYSDYIP